ITFEIGDLRQFGETNVLEIVRSAHDPRRLRGPAHELDPAPAERAVGRPDHVHQARAAAEHVGHDWKAGARNLVEQERFVALSLRRLGDGSELMPAVDLARNLAQRPGAAQLLEIGAHAGATRTPWWRP